MYTTCIKFNFSYKQIRSISWYFLSFAIKNPLGKAGMSMYVLDEQAIFLPAGISCTILPRRSIRPPAHLPRLALISILQTDISFPPQWLSQDNSLFLHEISVSWNFCLIKCLWKSKSFQFLREKKNSKEREWASNSEHGVCGPPPT